MKSHLRIAADVALDGEGCIAEDLGCLACGYNLRGLQPTGRCPECGIAIGRSAYGDLLRFCEPTWVNRLAEGMDWIYRSIILSFFLGLPLGLLAVLLSFLFGRNQDQFVQPAGAMILGLLLVVGFWRVTEPEPGCIQREERVCPRRLVRWTAVAACSVSVLDVPFAYYPGLCAGVVELVSSVLLLFNVLAVLTYARQMATRIPDLSLARQTRVVTWGTSVGLLAVVFFRLSCVLRLMRGAGSPGLRPPGGLGLLSPSNAAEWIATWVAASAIMVFGLWSLHLVDRFRKASREAARLARATWAKGPEEGS